VSWRWAYLTVPIPDDEAIKLSRAFSVGLDEAIAGGMVHRAGKKFSLLGPHQRMDLRIRPDSPIIDVLHRAAQLWDTGQPAEVVALLAESGYGDAAGFWDLARVLGALLPEGDRERTMYQQLTTSQEHLSRRAAQQSGGGVEEMVLFGT